MIFNGKVKVPVLNVREEPTTKSKKVGKLFYGSKVHGKFNSLVEADGYKWAKISSPIVGYVASEYINYSMSDDLDEKIVMVVLYYNDGREKVLWLQD